MRGLVTVQTAFPSRDEGGEKDDFLVGHFCNVFNAAMYPPPGESIGVPEGDSFVDGDGVLTSIVCCALYRVEACSEADRDDFGIETYEDVTGNVSICFWLFTQENALELICFSFKLSISTFETKLKNEKKLAMRTQQTN